MTRTMRRWLALTGLIVAGVLLAGPAGAQSAREILDKQSQLHRVSDETETLKITMVNKNGETKEREVVRYTMSGSDNQSKILIRFTSPRDVDGTGMLTWTKADGNDDQWLYLPAMRKVKRIASSGKKNRFMGTDFAYEDMRPESLQANTYSLGDNEVVDGADCWVIEAVPVNDTYAAATGYSKRKMWIRMDNHVTVKREYYDKPGKLEKVQEDRKFSVATGTAWRSDEVEMRDVQAGTKTTFSIISRAVEKGLGEAQFTLAELEEGGE